MEILLEHGANVNAQSKDGMTALHYAVETNNSQSCCLLLFKGAKLLVNSYSLTPDLHAAAMAQESLANLLLNWPDLLTKPNVSITTTTTTLLFLLLLFFLFCRK